MNKLNERFTDFADKVSSGMGTPLNIIIWLCAVISWFVLFAVDPSLQSSSFMPTWFTSLPFNLPLNLITTLAELYIGFLVAAAANRVERHNRVLQAQQLKIIQHIDSTAGQEEEEVADAEKRLLAQDQRIIAIAEHLDKQDAMILQIVQKLEPPTTPRKR